MNVYFLRMPQYSATANWESSFAQSKLDSNLEQGCLWGLNPSSQT